jgi:hypothetical protein
VVPYEDREGDPPVRTAPHRLEEFGCPDRGSECGDLRLGVGSGDRVRYVERSDNVGVSRIGGIAGLGERTGHQNGHGEGRACDGLAQHGNLQCLPSLLASQNDGSPGQDHRERNGRPKPSADLAGPSGRDGRAGGFGRRGAVVHERWRHA